FGFCSLPTALWLLRAGYYLPPGSVFRAIMQSNLSRSHWGRRRRPSTSAMSRSMQITLDWIRFFQRRRSYWFRTSGSTRHMRQDPFSSIMRTCRLENRLFCSRELRLFGLLVHHPAATNPAIWYTKTPKRLQSPIVRRENTLGSTLYKSQRYVQIDIFA